jgi:HK97 family phage prohead protease
MSEELLQRSMPAAMKAVRRESREADFIASTNAIDHAGESVTQDWDLTVYNRNPVVLFGHDSRDLPIGQCTRCEVVSGQLECTIKFASEAANPVAERVWQSVQEGTLRALSVGFMSGDYRMERRQGEDVWVLSQNKLLEISVVPIPMNPEALAKMKKRALERAMAAEQAKQSAPSGQESTIMTFEQKDIDALNAKVAAAESAKAVVEAKAAELSTALESTKAEVGLVTDKLKAITGERDAALESVKTLTDRVAKADEALIEKEVEALVGVKIVKSEKPAFIKLAKLDRGLFDETVKERPALNAVGPAIIVTESPENAASAKGLDLAALIEKQAATESAAE